MANNGHKKPKNQNFRNPLGNFVDISEMLSQNSKMGVSEATNAENN